MARDLATMRAELSQAHYLVLKENETWNVYGPEHGKPMLKTWEDRTEAEAIRQGWQIVFGDVY